MNNNNEEEEFKLPSNVNDLDTYISSLWDQYFNSGKNLSSTERKNIRESYNMAVEKRNKVSGFSCYFKLTASTRVEKRPGAEKVELVKQGSTNIVRKPTPSAGTSGSGKIQQIISLYISGKSKKEIIAAGFNKSTVNRQISEYDKRKK